MDRKIIASAIVLTTIASIGTLYLFLGSPGEEYLEFPPSERPPDRDFLVETVASLDLWSEAVDSQDFMPAIPMRGPRSVLLFESA
ncbi:MAG: hypothetical protein ACXAEN_14455 [Candidatus Thorarchaeota archaeon]